MNNIDSSQTKQVPVTDFLDRHQDSKPLLIGGLLDYGYTPLQIAGMTGIPLSDVYEIMTVNHFGTIQ